MNGLLVHAPTMCLSSVNFTHVFHNHLYPSKFFQSRVYPKCGCIRNKDTQIVTEGFSVLKSDNHCDRESLWSSMSFYLFSVHVPLSFGGLSAVTNILHRSALDPQTEALSLVVLQTLELIGVLLLLRCPGKPQYKLHDFFHDKQSTRERNWLLASALGLGFLVLLVFVTSIVADMFVGTKEVNNPILKEILSSGPISITSCTLVYCAITPLLEEIVYRGCLLTALSSTMKWQQAVIVCSVVFSAAHFSAENFIQLFILGLILGCSYCWSGNLRWVPYRDELKGHAELCNLCDHTASAIDSPIQRKMGAFENQVKKRAKELKTLFKKGVKIVQKGWHKVRHIKS